MTDILQILMQQIKSLSEEEQSNLLRELKTHYNLWKDYETCPNCGKSHEDMEDLETCPFCNEELY
jgi:rubrerythrin